MSSIDDITLITEPSREYLSERQQVDYGKHREQCLEWLLELGKEPDKAEGYAFITVKNRSQRMDQYYRWVWDREDGYTANPTHEHADAYLRHLAKQDTSNAHKNNCRKALMMLYKWRHHEHGLDKWDPELSFSSNYKTTNPQDYLTLDERSQIREAALEYGSIPSRASVYGDERERWRAYLAQRLEKPKEDITSDDWEQANGWEAPSLVWTSLDAALRPIEVQRATTEWVDIENAVLRIPKEESSKNTGNWTVGLQERTATVLDRWLDQREAIDRYDDTDALWLTQRGNDHSSQSLQYLLEKLCDIAGIDTEDRSMSWYSIRHSTGTYMTREEDLAAAQAQLRHKSPETTMRYDQTPVEDRRNALNRMN
jgi:site-specific recombinase XerD